MPRSSPSEALEAIRIAEAAERLRGVVRRTPLEPFDVGDGAGDERVELRLKLECLQETGRGRGTAEGTAGGAPERAGR